MKRSQLLTTNSRLIGIRIISLVLCYTFVAPAFGGWRFRNVSNRSASQQRPRPSSSPKPSPSGNGGKGQAPPSPYVPAALRTDNALVRSQGGRTTAVIPAPGKQRAPLSNLPDLAESRKRRQAPATKRNNKEKGGSKTDSAASRQVEMACGDCDPSGGGGVVGNTNDPYFGEARTEPVNETGDPGVTLGSQNFNWSLPLISLPGRAGLDLSLTLFYNSLVWVKQGSAILYNADHGTPAPGFQLGLPRLQDPFLDTNGTTTTADDVYAYMLITPSGGRVELKQIGSTSVYESTDGSFTQLTVSGSTRIVTTTDGTQLIFGTHVSPEWRCTRIEDRNGNYISATYDSSTGHASTITDTLGRTLTLHYDGDGNLSYISQPWEGGTRDFVGFYYKSQTMSPSFSGVMPYGANSSQTVLDYVVFDDNTSYHFDYNGYGQVYQIRHKAPDGHELEHTFYNLDNPGTQTDCPRFTERHDWAQDWLPGTQDAVTTYAVTTNATWTNPETSATETGTMVQQIAPDNTSYKEYSHASGWDEGLPRLGEFLDADGVKKKWISTTWTQDSESVPYPQNPRVIETNIYDDASNRRRTTIAHDVGYNLPTNISEYAANGTTVLRSTSMSYKDDSAYLDRRIIGLPLQRTVADGAGNIADKQEFQYDQGDLYFVPDQPSTNYDDTNYPSWFRVGRGNLTSVRRFDCTSNSTADNVNLAITIQRMGYNLAGSVVWAADASDHTTNISYTDSFSDNNNTRGTLAYATTVSDPDGFASAAQYNFDFGGGTNTHVPTSGISSSITYVDVTRTYDDFGRVLKIENQTDHSYTRFDYETNANYIHTYKTIIGLTQNDEFHSWQIFDGAGRVRSVAADHPGSSGGYTGQYTIYDKMSRVIEQSNPTEFAISGTSWVVAGDDVSVGWHSTTQDYDWKGRPHKTTNPDGTFREITYGGCGCAGGEVTYVRDEHDPPRERRYTKDNLGRLTTVQEMIWQTGTAYATTTYSYNTRDQLETINQAGQTRTFNYDGHGRLHQRITPEQGPTTYSYNLDDTPQVVTDARNVTTTYGYNRRHQITSLDYNVTGDPTTQAAPTASASFTYDAAGNRTSMTDGLGSASYAFNSQGQLYSETRNLTGVGSYAFNYEYNYAGELKKITDFRNVQVTYGYDKAGRLSNVGGANYENVTSYASNLAYRAFGAIKSMTYGDGASGQGHALSTAYDINLRPTTWKVTGVLGFNYQYDGYYHERTGRVIYAENTASSGGADSSLDRSYEYDAVGRLAVAHSGAEARAHVLNGQWGTTDGPYSQGYEYDVWGNVTHRYGWGGEVMGDNATHTPPEQSFTYSGNKRTAFTYDAAGNLQNDGIQTYAYDATGQQTSATWSAASYTPSFTDDPLNPSGTHTDIKLVHLTELRTEVNKLRMRAGLQAVVNWDPDPSPQANVTYVHHNHIVQLRTKLEEAFNALHLSIGTYEHSGPHTDDTIYAIDFQELRTKIKSAWTALSSSPSITQAYDGDGLRAKKNEYGATTYYLRSTPLSGQVVAELQSNGTWSRSYVYSGCALLAVQQDGVFWNYEDPVTKSKRVTDITGQVVSQIELDPWGADTNRSWNQAFQPHRYTSYERDGNGSDEAMFRRYNRTHSRFDQADPYEGSYDVTDPQSLNRYAYTNNDPVNRRDPSGLDGDPDFGLGPPPPPMILVPYGGTLVTNTSAPHYSDGGIGGWFGDDVGMVIVTGGVDGGTDGGGGGTEPPREFQHPQQKKFDPNSQFCQSLLQKIKNIGNDINKRIDEFTRNPLNLPMASPGSKLAEDQVGHIKIIMDYYNNYQRRIEEYTNKCGGPPPGVPPSLSPRPTTRRVPNGHAERRSSPWLWAIPPALLILACIACPECCAAAAPLAPLAAVP